MSMAQIVDIKVPFVAHKQKSIRNSGCAIIIFKIINSYNFQANVWSSVGTCVFTGNYTYHGHSIIKITLHHA